MTRVISPSPTILVTELRVNTATMMGISLAFAVLIVFAAIKYFNHTDIPKIKDLVEVPGVPLFGNLLNLGSSHAQACRRLATRYGPIFQVRLGNRVRQVICVLNQCELKIEL